MLSSWQDKRKNKISCRLLDLMTNLDGISFKFELVTIDVDVQVKVFIFVPFPINEKTALRIPFAKLGLEQIHCLPKRDRLYIMSARHEDNPPQRKDKISCRLLDLKLPRRRAVSI
jgi:hypothetical protein